MNVQGNSANRQIARAAGVVMAAFVLSNLTGLLRQILVTRAFGTGREIDAFSAASTYPDILFSLIAGGALASAFVPTLTTFLSRRDHENAWLLTSAVLNIGLVALTLTSAVSFFLAPQIVRYILAPSFDADQQALAASLLRILLFTPAIFGVSGILMGVLNSHQIFLWPALAPTMYWLGMIIGLGLFVPTAGIRGLAWGAVLGAGMHLGVQLPAFFKLDRWQYIPTLGRGVAAVREVGRLLLPRLLGVAVVQLNFLVNTILASGQPVGSLAAIKYAWAVMTMPQVVIAQAIAIAALPTFSAQAARGERKEMRASLAATLSGVILLSLPAALGLILLRMPITRLLFERGAFDLHSTQLVSWALLWYTVGLVAHSVVEVTSRAFYAMHDTKTPVFIGTGAMSLNLVFSLVFSYGFRKLGWLPHGGLALANSLATALEMGGLLLIMRRRLDGLDGQVLFQSGWRSATAALGMSVGLFIWMRLTGEQPAWLVAVGGIVLGLLIYAGCLVLLRLREAALLWAIIQRRLLREAGR